MATTKITLKRLQETTVDVEYVEAAYQEWRGDVTDRTSLRAAFVQSGRYWGDELDELLSLVRESDWETVASGDGDLF